LDAAAPTIVQAADIDLAAELRGLLPVGTIAYRLDGGAWRALVGSGRRTATIPLTLLANGGHLCEVRAFDRLLRPSNILKAKFVVERDYAAEMRKALGLLASPDFDVRESASRLLVSMGPAALPTLENALSTANADLGWWLDAVLREIRGYTEKVGDTSLSPEKEKAPSGREESRENIVVGRGACQAPTRIVVRLSQSRTDARAGSTRSSGRE